MASLSVVWSCKGKAWLGLAPRWQSNAEPGGVQQGKGVAARGTAAQRKGNASFCNVMQRQSGVVRRDGRAWHSSGLQRHGPVLLRYAARRKGMAWHGKAMLRNGTDWPGIVPQRTDDEKPPR